jgi:hypothetical protein
MRTAKFIVQREGNANNKYFASNFFFQTIHAGNAALGPWFTNDQCSKTIVWGTMDAGINNVIYMELHSGPKMANGTCGKTIVVRTINRGSTVLDEASEFQIFCHWAPSFTVAWRGVWDTHAGYCHSTCIGTRLLARGAGEMNETATD